MSTELAEGPRCAGETIGKGGGEVKAMRLEDMSPRLRRLAEAALGSGVAPRVGVAGSEGMSGYVKRFARRRGPNKTELAYALEFLSVGGVVKAVYEGITFRLPGGSRYTPDWYLFDGGGHTVVEVKGSYRLGSHGRAFTAWREARAAFPGFRFVWVERQNDGTWREKQ